MDEIIGYIANTGFPIAVTVFLLIRVEEKLDKLALSLRELAMSIQQIGGAPGAH